MCPGNVVEEATNVFATICELQGGTGNYKCINCTEGHQGDHCEECAQDFYGVPSDATVMPLYHICVMHVSLVTQRDNLLV